MSFLKKVDFVQMSVTVVATVIGCLVATKVAPMVFKGKPSVPAVTEGEEVEG
tara:strand:+ start:1870 stop:2025 length:156 start_codon:yes stop_codon:yes gene_type:complete